MEIGKNSRNSVKYIWSESDVAYLREHFPDEPSEDIADYFGVSSPTVRNKAKELGLKKSPSFSSNAFHGRYTNRYKRCKICA